MNRQQALNQLRLMQAWHEDNGNGPNADYDAICFAIEAIERSEELEKLITALETEHAKLLEMQSATDINVGTKETIYRQDAIDALAEQMPQPYTPDGSHPADKGIFMAQEIYADCIQTLEDLPPAQPEQRTGEYVHVSGYSDQYKCTACGIDIVPMRVVKFCPECGAKILKMTSGERIIYPWEGDV